METNIYKLPNDIINYIIPYTYTLQNKSLLNDIVSYKETKDTISELYYNFWIKYIGEIEPEDKNWIINDIFAYANNYTATMYGYVEKFYNIFRRHLNLDTCEDIDLYITNLEKKPLSSQINVIWGLLTIIERNEIILIFSRKNM